MNDKLLEGIKMVTKRETTEDRPESTIKPTNTWINMTRSKKGFIIYVKDDFKKGTILLGGTGAMQEFLDGDRNGINLGELTPVDED